MKTLYHLMSVLFVVAASNAANWECDVVPLRSWGGNMPMLRVEDLQIPVKLVVVTHTVTPECKSDGECRRIANAIRNNHLNIGFTDIALSFMVGANGKVYEGAGWKVGAHTSGYNNQSISLSFIGDFRDVAPSTKALDAAKKFLGCYVGNGKLASDYNVVGHRQLISTISPGDVLQWIIQTWPHWTSNVSKL